METELSRKFRVLDQTLSMHAILRDRYARWSLITDLVLLACSIVFCASAFASDEMLSQLGGPADHVRLFLRIVSVLAFGVSVLSLRVDWKGRAASHREAAEKLSRAVAMFRKCREPDGTWLDGTIEQLDGAYWEAMRNSVPVPESKFASLKAKHLQKVELSRLLDEHPGCPVFVLKSAIMYSSLKRILERGKDLDVQ